MPTSIMRTTTDITIKMNILIWKIDKKMLTRKAETFLYMFIIIVQLLNFHFNSTIGKALHDCLSLFLSINIFCCDSRILSSIDGD